jgi:hypothetical protein
MMKREKVVSRTLAMATTIRYLLKIVRFDSSWEYAVSNGTRKSFYIRNLSVELL